VLWCAFDSRGYKQIHGAQLNGITTREGEPVGRRLGYVFQDVIWLLLGDIMFPFVAAGDEEV